MEYADTNRIIIKGTVNHVSDREKTTYYNIVTDGNNGNHAFIDMIYFKKDANEDYFNKGENVTIDCFGKLIRQSTGENKRTIIIRSIEQTKRDIFKYISPENISPYDGGRQADVNEGCIIGTVQRVYEASKEITILTIKTQNVDIPSNTIVNVTCFLRQSEIARSFKLGDRIACSCHIQTARVEKDDSIINFYVDIIADDIDRIG